MKPQNITERLFYEALRIRLVEASIIELYPSDKIQSPVHLSIGQEAVAVGVCAALKTSDPLFGTYRSHAFYLAKGGCLKQMFAELYGRRGGCAKGKAGSMHLMAPEVGFMGSSAVVASTIAHAVGAAYAVKLFKRNQVVTTVFGDGATEEGVYHESLNFASLKKLPTLFICENNGLAVHAKTWERQAFKISQHVRAYGMPYVCVKQGYDLMAVARAARAAVRYVRRCGTPYYLEIKTCRYKEHVGVNDDLNAGYRTQAELDRWKRNDPLVTDGRRVAKYSGRIRKEINEAIRYAEASPVPGAADLLQDVIER